MAVERVALLHDGFFEIDMGMLVYLKSSYYGRKYLAALKPMLVQTHDSNVLIDTGICDLPDSHARFYNVQRKGKGIVASLKAHGLAPEDIDMVVNTHLHVDHAGNDKLFGNARFLAQKKEIEYAKNPRKWMRGGYLADSFSNIEFEGIEGDRKIMEGLSVILTGGHTPGHQAVVVECNASTYIYCGDVAPLRENLEKRTLTGILYNPLDAESALERLASIKGTHIFSHDNEQMTL